LAGCISAVADFSAAVTWLLSTEMFLSNLDSFWRSFWAGYFQLVCRILTAMGPPDWPHVIAVINVPERLYCPRLVRKRPRSIGSSCGVNIEKQYRKMVRKLHNTPCKRPKATGIPRNVPAVPFAGRKPRSIEEKFGGGIGIAGTELRMEIVTAKKGAAAVSTAFIDRPPDQPTR